MEDNETMQAVIWHKYGPPEVLEPAVIPKPTIDSIHPNDVIIKIEATTITAGDGEMRSLKFPWYLAFLIRMFLGIRKPKGRLLGQEFAGIIETIGTDVSKFSVGDRVLVAGELGKGTYSEYYVYHENKPIVKLPDNVSYAQAAPLIVGGLNALHFLRMANIEQGTNILINGAGGSIGTYAISLAKHYGARVTAVDSADKLQILRDLGADEVIDYQSEKLPNLEYDVVFDMILRSSYRKMIRRVKPNGMFLIANPTFSKKFQKMFTSVVSNKQVSMKLADNRIDDMEQLVKLMGDGVLSSKIDREYEFKDVVEAHKYIDTGKKIGHVILYPGSKYQ